MDRRGTSGLRARITNPARARVTLLALAILMAASVLALVSASRAMASADCIDSFDCYSLAEAFNGSQKFTANTNFDVTTDVSSFTLQSGERHNCALPNGGVTWGDRSAWYRFDAGVDGTLNVSADTTVQGQSGFNVLMVQYEATHGDPIDYTTNGDLPSRDCTAHGTKISFLSALRVHTSRPTFVQVLTYGGDTAAGGADPCTGNEPAGKVQLHFAFTATDSDGDGIPDTVDKCPGVYGATADGCPPPPAPRDSDGDGIPDSQDHCQTVSGLSQYDGCPDADGDGVPEPQDQCPTQKGPAITNGCPDSDKDGIADRTDKCPHDFAVSGYSFVGSGQLGCPEPLAAEVAYGWSNAVAKSVTLTYLDALDVPHGARVTVTCSGRGCPRRQLASVVEGQGRLSLMSRLRAGGLRHGKLLKLPVGVRLTTTITFPGTLGYSRTVVPRAKKSPQDVVRCLRGTRSILCPV
jgi:hypothetical protein